MKNSIKALLFLFASCLTLSVCAGTPETVVIDENGNGTWVDTESTSHAFSGTFMADPSGGRANALVYTTTLFTFDVQGDYKIVNPNTLELVGMVRFFNNNTMIFYDNDVGDIPSLADGSGIPDNSLLPTVSLFQTLLGEPGSSTVVSPINGMAGFAGVERQYTFLSVLPVPEPGVLSLLACSAVLLTLRRKRPVA
jgi:hypothetical protein